MAEARKRTVQAPAGADPATVGRRKHWGWGYEHEQPRSDDLRKAATAIAEHLGFTDLEIESPKSLEQVSLRRPRVRVPRPFAAFCSASRHTRARHALGSSYVDTVLGFDGRFESPPDFVARPESEQDLEALLEWCTGHAVAAVPYGGGSSVVGGVNMPAGERYRGAVSIDTTALAGVREVDPVSQSARIGAGTLGPQIERELASHGLTLRHFPQSFQFSTLGGWIATRAAGHFATGATHIEERVQSVRAITPSGIWQSRRLPASGAGVSPDRMLAGSEGTLGVITEAWVRLVRRPDVRARASIRFADFTSACDCAMALAQSGLQPANCRVLDGAETAITALGTGENSILLLGFESAAEGLDGGLEAAEVDARMRRALAICALHGGSWDEPVASDAAQSWRSTFFAAPYLRDVMVAAGLITETFETAVTWDRLSGLVQGVRQAAAGALAEQVGAELWQPGQDASGPGRQSRNRARLGCRLTHVYPDGAAPYFTVIAAAPRGGQIECWQQIKQAVSAAIIEAGGTITHHHAVGRDHMPWYVRQRPEPFSQALAAAKAGIDPAWIMNPGVLLSEPG